METKESGLPARTSLTGSEKVPIKGDEYFVLNESANTERAARGENTKSTRIAVKYGLAIGQRKIAWQLLPEGKLVLKSVVMEG